MNRFEFETLEECEYKIKNIGWTLGNDCPYKCNHCYSMSVRNKGMDLTKEIVDTIIDKICSLNVETVNLGGNEPIFTNGLDIKKTMLPYIIRELDKRGVAVGLTTSGITAIYLEREYPDVFEILNDIDVSLDSPFEEEHNYNRGNNIYILAIKALQLCKKYNKESTLIMCAMNWNFTERHIREMVNLAKRHNANIRINALKPVENKHMESMIDINQYYKGYKLLTELCETIDMTDPILSGVVKNDYSKRCPCGRTSFRIHSITPDGKVPISPCVYLHDFKVGDLLTDNISELITSKAFKQFRIRNKNPNVIRGCDGCELISVCGGGCAAMAYLYNKHKNELKTLFVKDPYCYKNVYGEKPTIKVDKIDSRPNLVHVDYLCTWIGTPK